MISSVVTCTGITGPTEPTGPAGSDGATGTADTLAVGTVRTGEPEELAAISDSGEGNNHIFDFVIPRGATGATGPKGEEGPVKTQCLFAAKGSYIEGQNYINFDNSEIFPQDFNLITADGSDINLNKDGLYLINYKTNYKLECYGGTDAVLELNGGILFNSRSTMCDRNGNSCGLFLLQASQGSTLKIKLSAPEKLKSAEFYVVITHFKLS